MWRSAQSAVSPGTVAWRGARSVVCVGKRCRKMISGLWIGVLAEPAEFLARLAQGLRQQRETPLWQALLPIFVAPARRRNLDAIIGKKIGATAVRTFLAQSVSLCLLTCGRLGRVTSQRECASRARLIASRPHRDYSSVQNARMSKSVMNSSLVTSTIDSCIRSGA